MLSFPWKELWVHDDMSNKRGNGIDRKGTGHGTMTRVGTLSSSLVEGAFGTTNGGSTTIWPVFSHLQGQGRLRSGISHKTESEMMTMFTVLSWTVFTVFLVITLSWALFFYSHIRVGRAFRNIYYLWGRRGLTRNSPNSRATFSYPIDQLLPLDLRSLMLWEIAVGLWNDLSQISVGP